MKTTKVNPEISSKRKTIFLVAVFVLLISLLFMLSLNS